MATSSEATDSTDQEDVENAVFAVEKVVESRIGKNGKRYYKVRWADSWEPEENLEGCADLIAEFWKTAKAKGKAYKQKPSADDRENEKDKTASTEAPDVKEADKDEVTEDPTGNSNDAAIGRSETEEEEDVKPNVTPLVNSEPVQAAPRTKSSLQTQLRKQHDDATTSSKVTTPLAPTTQKETRLTKRLQSDTPIEVNEDAGGTSEQTTVDPNVQVKEEPVSEDEEEELFKRTAKLKASFCIQRYLEQDSGDESEPGSDDAWEEPENPFSPMEAEPPLQNSNSLQKQPDAEKQKLEKDMLATFPEELKKRVTKLLQTNSVDQRQNPSLQTVFESVSLKMAEEIASRVYNDWKLTDNAAFKRKINDLHRQMLSTMESFPNMKTFQPVLPPGAKPMLASRPQLSNYRQIAPRPQGIPSAQITPRQSLPTSIPASKPSIGTTISAPQSQLLIQRPMVPPVAVVNPRSLITPQGQLMVAASPHMLLQGQRFISGQPRQVFIRQPSPHFAMAQSQNMAMAQSQALVQSSATMVMARPNLIAASPGMAPVNRFNQAAFAPINTVRNTEVRAFTSVANASTTVTMATPQSVVATSNTFIRPPVQTPPAADRPSLQPIGMGLQDQLNQLDPYSPPKSISNPTIAATPTLTTATTPTTSTSSATVTSAASTDEECQITKAVGIMPAINLPNGKKLKLVPEGNVPENVRNYVRDNYEEILKRLSVDKDKGEVKNLRNQRLLVHADGTLEMSSAQRKPPPPNNTSDTPIVIDMDDDDETPPTTATTVSTQQSSTTIQTPASVTSQHPTGVPQGQHQVPISNIQFLPHPNVMNPRDPNSQIRQRAFLTNMYQQIDPRTGAVTHIDPRTGAVIPPHMITPQQIAQQQLRQLQPRQRAPFSQQQVIPQMPQGDPIRMGPSIQHMQGTPIQQVMQPVYANQMGPIVSQGQLNAQFAGARAQIVQRPLNFRNPQHSNMRHPPQGVTSIPPYSAYSNNTHNAVQNAMNSVTPTKPAPVSIDIDSDDDTPPSSADVSRKSPHSLNTPMRIVNQDSNVSSSSEHSKPPVKSDTPLIDRNKADALALTVQMNQQRYDFQDGVNGSKGYVYPGIPVGEVSPSKDNRETRKFNYRNKVKLENDSSNNENTDVNKELDISANLTSNTSNNVDLVNSDLPHVNDTDSTVMSGNVVKKAGLNLFGLLGGSARKRISAKFTNALSNKLFRDKLRDVRRFKVPVSCHKCKKSFRFRSQMLNHLLLFHRESPSNSSVSNAPSNLHVCKKCNRSHISSTHLSNHMWFAHRIKSFQCKACKKKFITKKLAMDHFKATHWLIRNKDLCAQCSSNPRTQPSSNELKPGARSRAISSVCDVYRASILNKCLCRKCGGSLRAKEGEFSCKYCLKLFLNKATMLKHQRLHSKIMRTANKHKQQYACLECGKLWNSRKSLNKHKKDVHAVL